MAIITLTAIIKEPSGIWRVRFGDGTEREYSGVQHILDNISQTANDETTKDAALGWWLARSPDGSNVNLVEGKTFTFDLSAPNPFRVQ